MNSFEDGRIGQFVVGTFVANILLNNFLQYFNNVLQVRLLSTL